MFAAVAKVDMMSEPLSYRNFHIVHYRPPIPTRKWDWQYCHDDYDGADDANDSRCGCAESLEECFNEIDELEREQSYE